MCPMDVNECGILAYIYIYIYIYGWLAQLVKALDAPTHVRSCVQEVRVRSPEQTSSALAFIPPG